MSNCREEWSTFGLPSLSVSLSDYKVFYNFSQKPWCQRNSHHLNCSVTTPLTPFGFFNQHSLKLSKYRSDFISIWQRLTTFFTLRSDSFGKQEFCCRLRFIHFSLRSPVRSHCLGVCDYICRILSVVRVPFSNPKTYDRCCVLVISLQKSRLRVTPSREKWKKNWKTCYINKRIDDYTVQNASIWSGKDNMYIVKKKGGGSKKEEGCKYGKNFAVLRVCTHGYVCIICIWEIILATRIRARI